MFLMIFKFYKYYMKIFIKSSLIHFNDKLCDFSKLIITVYF